MKSLWRTSSPTQSRVTLPGVSRAGSAVQSAVRIRGAARVSVSCHEKRVPYTLVPVMPHTAEVDAIHPLGKIPALRHGDLTLGESRAICFYIDHAFEGPPLVSRDPAEGARTEQWISIVNTHFDVLVARPYSRRPPRFAYELSADGRELAGALRLLTEWGAARSEHGEPLRHGACGTPLEARWYCPTCARPVEDDEAGDGRGAEFV